MRSVRWLVVPVVVLAALSSVPTAEPKPSDVDQLRRQVESMTQQMRALEDRIKVLEARLAAQATASVSSIAPPSQAAAAGAAHPLPVPPASPALGTPLASASQAPAVSA